MLRGVRFKYRVTPLKKCTKIIIDKMGNRKNYNYMKISKTNKN